jgi:pilus assembly protein CpaF
MMVSYGAAFEQLTDQAVTEMHIIGCNIIVKRHGVHERLPQQFESDEAVVVWLNRLLERSSQLPIVTSSPLREFSVDLSSNGRFQRVRVHVVLPPLSPVPTVTIAKQAIGGLTLDDMVNNSTLTFDAADFLTSIAKSRVNVLIAGGGGAGKTTLMTALLEQVPEYEILGIIEELPELAVSHPNTISLYNRPVPSPNRVLPAEQLTGALLEYAEQLFKGGSTAIEIADPGHFLLWLGHRAIEAPGTLGAEPVSLSRLVREAMRMRLDRLALGEVRGPEAMDLLVAMNTGTVGLGTIHANSALDAVRKIQTLAAVGGFDPGWVLTLVAQAINIVVFMRQPEVGLFGVEEILEITGRVVSDTTLTTQVLFERKGSDLVRAAMPSPVLSARLRVGKY